MSDIERDEERQETMAETDTPEKWVYQGPAKTQKQGLPLGEVFASLLAGVFYLVVFAVLPIFVFIAVDWVVYFVTKDTFFRDGWVTPTVLIASTFLSGAYSRIIMEDSFKTMGVMVIGLFGLMIFAYVTHLMLSDPGSLYSTWLPSIPTVDPAIAFGLPFVGLIGMFCYKFFSLRHFI